MTHAFQLAAAAITATCLAACTSPPASTNAASIRNSCINPTEIAKQTIVSDQEIRFEMRNGDVWVNALTRACSGLKFAQGFSWGVRGMTVCSNQQTITVLQSGATCQLGEFKRETPKT